MKLDKIINGTDISSACADIELKMAMIIKPRIFTGRKSAEIEYDKHFEDMCLILVHNLQVDTHFMNVMQFYNAFEFLKHQLKQKQKTIKQHG